MHKFIFDIPEQTPAGEYLLRLDLIWPGLWEPPIYVSDTPQIYASCAQILVESNAPGPLPEGIEIPAGLNTLTPGERRGYEHPKDIQNGQHSLTYDTQECEPRSACTEEKVWTMGIRTLAAYFGLGKSSLRINPFCEISCWQYPHRWYTPDVFLS